MVKPTIKTIITNQKDSIFKTCYRANFKVIEDLERYMKKMPTYLLLGFDSNLLLSYVSRPHRANESV